MLKTVVLLKIVVATIFPEYVTFSLFFVSEWKSITVSNIVFNIDNNNKCFLSTESAY